MKKITFILSFLFLSAFVHAQGLQDIIVETYYISDAADSAAVMDDIGDTLPAGSVTYRIYVDMLPGYEFQAAYGSPTHDLHITTTTLFYNNSDRGATTPNGISVTNSKKNAVMLDSWLSVGATATGKMGVIKPEDTDGSVGNTSGILQNTDAAAGIPVMTQDGQVAGTPQTVTTVGIDNELPIFDNARTGNSFFTNNGSWASLSGSAGPTASNKVLIAQITTDGVLSFELNIQIGDTTPNTPVEKYVAKNPIDNEIPFPAGLIYNSSTVKVNKAKQPVTAFSVYPNPTCDAFTLEIAATKQSNNNSYTIYDQKGSVVFSKQLGMITEKYIEQIDVSKLAAGQYFVELTIDGIASAKKIIKN